MRLLTCSALVALLSVAVFGQSTDAAHQFEIADVHVSPKNPNNPNQFVRTGPVRNGRYEIRGATMVDLVRIAYDSTPDKVLEGPNWLELDRFDVIAKVPRDSTAEMQKLMLQALLADRFKLVVRRESRALPTYALSAGKKLQIKEADGTGDTGCKPQTSSAAPPPPGTPPDGTIRLMISTNGQPQAIVLAPGGVITYLCRNMTMAAFAEGLRGMLGTNVGANPVLDQTGLKGMWNFNLHYSIGFFPLGGDTSNRISIVDAVDKQLGLKLEEKPNPTPVIVVESVNRTPTENPPGLAKALPTPAAATEFEVAEVKPSDPAGRGGNFQMQPGGRLTVKGMPMRFLITRAFNGYMNDQIVGLPNWADSERFDITAKAPAEAQMGPGLDPDALAPMMRALLVDRFQMTYHTEERQLPAYSLVASKPKIKKADPASRISCKTGPAPPGSPQGSIMLTCQNITMALLAERLRNLAPGFNGPVADNTGIEGGWDFNLVFSQLPPALLNGPLRGGADAPQPGGLQASDPGGGYSIFEAIEKQLGLKLEQQKRPVPVVVIDHIEQRPTDN
jgi:uncharacterized protein (TIGR03435 family)